jgi:hypothetical protein
VSKRFKFCIRCRRTIAQKEFDRGLFVDTANGPVCATCARRLDEETAGIPLGATEPQDLQPPKAKSRPKAEPEPTKPAPAQQRAMPEIPKDHPLHSLLRDEFLSVLTGLREHLEHIHRSVLFEKSSHWNVLGTAAEALTIAFLVIAGINWTTSPDKFILAAIVFQIMALAFFVRGK